MIRAILLLHGYICIGGGGGYFLGQRLHWVELPSSSCLQALLRHLTYGAASEQLRGTEAFPTESAGFAAIKRELYLIRQTFQCSGVGSRIDTVKVVGITFGWPIDPPEVLGF